MNRRFGVLSQHLLLVFALKGRIYDTICFKRGIVQVVCYSHTDVDKEWLKGVEGVSCTTYLCLNH